MKAQDIRYLVIHCSATRCNRPYSLAQMDRDHRARGFAGIGYHYYIRLNGDICALRGRDEVGAHVRGYNRMSLGICYEGGLNPSRKQALLNSSHGYTAFILKPRL